LIFMEGLSLSSETFKGGKIETPENGKPRGVDMSMRLPETLGKLKEEGTVCNPEGSCPH